MSDPRGFVVVGGTDWWSAEYRHVNMGTDSRLRAFAKSTAAAWTSVVAANARALSATPVYAELMQTQAGGSLIFGAVSASGRSGILTSFAGASAASGGYYNVGQIYDGLGGAQSVAAWGNGDRVGIACYINSSGSPVAQFYKNGAAVGTPISLSASEVYLVASAFEVGVSGLLCVDGPEIRFLPTGAQPWGAAARVADRGGYSPASTSFSSSHVSYSLDAFRKTVSGTTTATGLAIAADARTTSSGFEYDEWEIEADTGTLGFVGLAPANTATSALPGDGSTFAFNLQNGQKRTGGSGSSYGSAPAVGQRIGQLREVATGKVYWSIQGTWQNGGDPEAGTGFAFDTAVGDLVPVATPYQGRLRLCSHAREQLYRPSYATARDGADLLPEQHYTDRLRSAPRVRREVSYFPWANQRNRGAAIGSVDLINADGAYDALSDYDLRDQPIIAYTVRSDGSTAREWTGLIDGVTLPDARSCRIAVADSTAKLAERVASPVFALGSPELIPSRSRIGSVVASDVAQDTLSGFQVYDRALLVTSWTRSDVGGVSGFQRTVNPAGLQSVRGLRLVHSTGQKTVTNGDLSSWSSGAPVGWSVYINDNGGTAGSVTQSGGSAVLTGGSVGYAGIWQSIGTGAFEVGKQYAIVLQIDAATSAGGGMFVQLSNAAGAVELGGPQLDASAWVEGASVNYTDTAQTGRVVFFTGALSSALNGVGVYAAFSDTWTISSFEVYEFVQTGSIAEAFAHLIEVEAGQPSTSWEYSAPLAPYSPPSIGYWSDQRPTIRAVLGEVCDSALLDYYTDTSGVIRLAWMVPPEEVTSSDAEWIGEIVEADVYGDLTVADDYAPSLSTVAEYQRNYAKHDDGDVAGAVTAAVRQYVTSDSRENQLDVSSVSAGDAGPLHPFYAFANDAPKWPRLDVTLYNDNNTPLDGAGRDNRLIMLHRCYAVRRRFYSCRISRERFDALQLRPGGVVELTHRRYGLSAGKQLMVAAVEPQLMSPTVSITLWG